MSLIPNAALDVLEALEQAAPASRTVWTACSEPDEDGDEAVSVKDADGRWVAIFAFGVPLETAAFMARLHNESHNLLCFARLGLEACGITGTSEGIGACRSCGSASVEVSHKTMPGGRVVMRVRCLDCNDSLTQLHPGIEPEREPMPGAS